MCLLFWKQANIAMLVDNCAAGSALHAPARTHTLTPPPHTHTHRARGPDVGTDCARFPDSQGKKTNEFSLLLLLCAPSPQHLPNYLGIGWGFGSGQTRGKMSHNGKNKTPVPGTSRSPSQAWPGCSTAGAWTRGWESSGGEGAGPQSGPLRAPVVAGKLI